MRNFTFNPFVQNKFATAKTYIAELNNNVESLLEYIELTNPNYSILNKNLGGLVDGAPYYTDKQLLDAGVLKIAINNTSSNPYAFILICPNKLKLHRGIVQKYGPTCRMSLKDDPQLASRLYSELGENEKLLVDELIKKFFGEISNEERNIIKVFDITDTKDIHYIPQGRVVFSQVQVTSSDTDNKYKDINNYSIYPVTSPGTFYIPDLMPDKTKWTWKISEQKILDDLVVFFNWLSPNLRFYTKNSLLNYVGYNIIKANTDSRTNNFLSFEIGSDNKIKPHITSYSGTMWTGADVNRLLTNYYSPTVIIETEKKIIEEEILLDDSIDFGKDKLVNYSNPYYNITIEHEHIPENFVRVKLW